MLGLGLGVDKIRPSGVFSPDQLNDLSAWYKADAGITTVSGAVSVWADQSGSGLDLTQSTAADRPAYGSVQLNGIDVLTFDGTDVLNGSYPNDFFGLSDLTIFAVTKADTNIETGAIFQKRTAVLDGNIGLGYLNGDLQFQTRDSGTGDEVANTVTAYDTWELISVQRDTNGIYIYSPETITQLGTAADLTSTGTFEVGTGGSYGGLNGSIAEIIIYKRALSSDERTQVSDYLTSKWGL